MMRVYSVTLASDPDTQLALLKVDNGTTQVVWCRDATVRGILSAPQKLVSRSRLVSFNDGVGISVGTRRVPADSPVYFEAVAHDLSAAGYAMNEVVPLPVTKSVKGSVKPGHKYIRREATTGPVWKYVYNAPSGKFDASRMRALLEQDKFLARAFATLKGSVHNRGADDAVLLERVFNTYVVGDSAMMRKYKEHARG